VRLVSRETRALGDMLPPWWYALGRDDFRRGEQHYYVLPVALLVRVGCWVRYRWDRLRSRPFSNRDRAAYFEGERVGYDRGYKAAEAHGLREAVALIRNRTTGDDVIKSIEAGLRSAGVDGSVVDAVVETRPLEMTLTIKIALRSIELWPSR
jgi:hypothetical protein